MFRGPLYGLLAALLFGASTPFAKLLVGHVEPLMLAALLYLGSGIGLASLRLLLRGRSTEVPLKRSDWPWLAGAVVSGGVVGPVLLMLGLLATPASAASLLLNLEGVLTAAIAWFVFKENYDRRILAGMGLIVAGGVLLSWSEWPQTSAPWGMFAIMGACACWAIDNNLSRKVAASDAMQIASIKGLAAGSVNMVIALTLGYSLPLAGGIASAATLGFVGYGLSLVFFVLSLRHVGTARTGGYFAIAPFAGALISLIVLGEAVGSYFWWAALLMALGVGLHLLERHQHVHTHDPAIHEHGHSHDAHHQHAHDSDWDGHEPHVHAHEHLSLTHSHAHFPDIHHEHSH